MIAARLEQVDTDYHNGMKLPCPCHQIYTIIGASVGKTAWKAIFTAHSRAQPPALQITLPWQEVRATLHWMGMPNLANQTKRCTVSN